MKSLRLVIGAVTATVALFAIGRFVEDRKTSYLVWSLSAVTLGALFYSVRRQNRLVYGLIEMIAAIAALFFLLLRFGPGEMTVELIAARTVAILATVYVMVRAFDSIGEGLESGSRLENQWTSLFPKAEKPGEVVGWHSGDNQPRVQAGDAVKCDALVENLSQPKLALAGEHGQPPRAD